MLLNLDSLLLPDREIQLDGNKYTLSTNISTKLMLEFQRSFQQSSESEETTKTMLEIIAFAFRKNYPEMTKEVIIEKLNMQQLTALIQMLFSGNEETTIEKK